MHAHSVGAGIHDSMEQGSDSDGGGSSYTLFTPFDMGAEREDGGRGGRKGEKGGREGGREGRRGDRREEREGEVGEWEGEREGGG